VLERYYRQNSTVRGKIATMNKVVSSVQEAIAAVGDGAIIAVPGFFTCGVPRDLLWGLVERASRTSRYAGVWSLVGAKDIAAALVKNGQLKKVIDSYSLNRSAPKECRTLLRSPSGMVTSSWRYIRWARWRRNTQRGGWARGLLPPDRVGSVVEKETLTNVLSTVSQGR